MRQAFPSGGVLFLREESWLCPCLSLHPISILNAKAQGTCNSYVSRCRSPVDQLRWLRIGGQAAECIPTTHNHIYISAVHTPHDGILVADTCNSLPQSHDLRSRLEMRVKRTLDQRPFLVYSARRGYKYKLPINLVLSTNHMVLLPTVSRPLAGSNNT